MKIRECRTYPGFSGVPEVSSGNALDIVSGTTFAPITHLKGRKYIFQYGQLFRGGNFALGKMNDWHVRYSHPQRLTNT
jgi:hypothetical protein